MGAGITLIIGGARSGKSGFAEKLAARHDRVLFVATAEALDDEMRQRIENHRRDHLAHWQTLEAPRDIVTSLDSVQSAYDVLLLDCLTLWVSNLLLNMEGHADAERRIVGAAEALLAEYDASDAE